MNPPSVSVVVVSRDRPALLSRCLTGISQLQYSPFEVVVVADKAGLAAARALPFAEALKVVACDVANISTARNLGIAEAAGDVVAFIDDDAVPEPTWLRYLVAPAAQAEVAAMGGFVLGRNGISFQWQAQSLDRFGWPHDLALGSPDAAVLRPPSGWAIKTEGTNMAFRRDVLVDLGGFDPAFHYFLDETDLNFRLARAGHATALVPMAQVHHGFAGNAVRRANRVPRNLFEIGASWAVFQRKHLPEAEWRTHWKALRRRERQRLVKHMQTGGLDPWDVLRLMRGLDRGYAEGQSRALVPPRIAAHPNAAFQPFPAAERRSVVVKSRPARFRAGMTAATEKVKNGEIVTLMSLSPSTMYHRVYFDPRGVWVQKGGLWGRAERSEPLMRMTTRSRRIEKERRRVASLRGLRDE